MSTSIYSLPPGTFVELTDLILSVRKLGLVDETGLGYFELHTDELPKPLHIASQPVGVGSIASWITVLDEDEAEPWMNAWDELTSRNLDVLTIARGLRWGMENAIADVDLLQKMGEAATEQVHLGRTTIEKAVC